MNLGWGGRLRPEGCVSVTAINGLIMYLAVLAVVRREKGGRGSERGLTACHGWLKASREKRERPCLLG